MIGRPGIFFTVSVLMEVVLVLEDLWAEIDIARQILKALQRQKRRMDDVGITGILAL